MTILYYIFISFLFLKIALIDYIEHYIYDRDLLISLVIILGYNFYSESTMLCLTGLTFGIIVGLLQFFLGYLMYKTEAYGSGDVFLLAILGAFLGSTTFIDYFVFLHLLLGAVLFIILLLKPSWKRKAIPLAPIYIIGMFLFLLANKPTFVDQLKFFISMFENTPF